MEFSCFYGIRHRRNRRFSFIEDGFITGITGQVDSFLRNRTVCCAS
ncbi:hypothetical protein BACPLE_01180 [Phocaeicola plebeius DSM 17135]|uniref:Uncharacterized protein n=1 Tax=Phocaeicola plebeius (strain DSM 17135 / JCM 12973 / CCUG 54634 / M2) TaxID=484018 RepID=B5CWU0_PHOPM|nr:hypothetical protein BACPLE_01180 [Phocaeicola plebeius DSM 17135]